MPAYIPVQGYSSQTQQTRLCIETGIAPGESLLMPLSTGMSTMSLTTQPNTISATTGMHLHFFIFGNTTAGSVVITGTNASGGAQTSITYNVPVAPQNNQGYTEFTTKEAWGTATASAIALTTLTPCQVMVFGSFAAKFLLPINLDKEEKIPRRSPDDHRGILFKSFRANQLTKGVDVSKLDSDLYPDSLWAWYMSMGAPSSATTIPATPTSLMASTAKAATMTLTTPPTAPGMFLVFTIGATNILAGTIVLSGLDNYGATITSETLTVPASGPATLYSAHRYSSLTSSTFATTGMTTGVTITVTGVFGWDYGWIWDGINDITPYSGCIEAFDGVEGVVLPGVVLSDINLAWEKAKEITLATKGTAQDFCIVGDPGSIAAGVNPFAILAQPTSLPMVSWPGSFYLDPGTSAPMTTQDGTFLTYKFGITTGRKWEYAGDGQQRPAYVTWDGAPDYSVDAEIISINYSNYARFFKPNTTVLLVAAFQGNWLGANFYEGVTITTPCKVDSWKIDQTKTPVSGSIKVISEYSFSNGYAYKVSVVSQTPPTYLS